jgi:hypothetical protein
MPKAPHAKSFRTGLPVTSQVLRDNKRRDRCRCKPCVFTLRRLLPARVEVYEKELLSPEKGVRFHQQPLRACLLIGLWRICLRPGEQRYFYLALYVGDLRSLDLKFSMGFWLGTFVFLVLEAAGFATVEITKKRRNTL